MWMWLFEITFDKQITTGNLHHRIIYKEDMLSRIMLAAGNFHDALNQAQMWAEYNDCQVKTIHKFQQVYVSSDSM
jgi:hypothetical protein